MGRSAKALALQGVKLQEASDVRPGDKGLAGPGKQEHPDPRVRLTGSRASLDSREHLAVQGIEFVRAVEGDEWRLRPFGPREWFDMT